MTPVRLQPAAPWQKYMFCSAYLNICSIHIKQTIFYDPKQNVNMDVQTVYPPSINILAGKNYVGTSSLLLMLSSVDFFQN